MAVEKGKVIAILNTKFKGKSVSKELKEAYATRWAAKIETDDDIQTFVDDREDDVLEAAKEADRRATAAATKAKQEAADAVTGKQAKQDETEPVVTDDMPPYMKTFMKQMETLTNTVNGLQQAKTAESIADRFKKDERLKDVPEKLLAKWTPSKDEDFETAVTDLLDVVGTITPNNTTASGGNTQQPAGKNFGADKPTGGANAASTGGKAAAPSKEEVADIMAQL